MKSRKTTILIVSLLAGAFVISAFPLVVLKQSDFSGADSKAEQAILETDKTFKRWAEPLWTPPGPETETLLFTLQGAVGAGVVCYILGYLHGRSKKERGENDPD